MSPISMRPRWSWERVPCPVCEQQRLAYDGSVMWRGGSRPGRDLATKGSVGFSPRADFDIAHYFHCEACGVMLYDAVHSSSPWLYVESEANEP